MSNATLLAVVEVAQELRVRCRAPDCHRTVWKRIHVVQDGSLLTVLGEDCFAKLYGSALASSSAKYTGGASRPLTEEERDQLEYNTEFLIAEFQRRLDAKLAETAAQAEAKAEEASRFRELHAQYIVAEELRRLQRQEDDLRRQAIRQALDSVTDGERAVLENQVRQELTRKYLINTHQPGWNGWVKATVKQRILESRGLATPAGPRDLFRT